MISDRHWCWFELLLIVEFIFEKVHRFGGCGSTDAMIKAKKKSSKAQVQIPCIGVCLSPMQLVQTMVDESQHLWMNVIQYKISAI